MPPESDDRASLVDMLEFTPKTRQAHSAIPWQDIIGMRNIIAHEYGKIDLDEIWKTVQSDAPKLLSALEEIVARLPPPP